MLFTQTGTPYYASPEVWNDMPYDSSSDIWSLGCVLYEMTSLKPPFLASNMEALFSKVCKGKYANIPAIYSSDLKRIISLMMQLKPNKRPTADEILNSKIVKDKIDELYIEESETSSNIDKNLLETILIPEEMKNIQSSLPKSNYSSSKVDFIEKFLNGQLVGKIPNTKTTPEDSSRKVKSRRNNSSQRKILREVFKVGMEKSKSKESTRKDNTQSRPRAGKEDIDETIKSLKKALKKQKKKLINSPSNASIPLSYMSNVKRVRNNDFKLPVLSQQNSPARRLAKIYRRKGIKEPGINSPEIPATRSRKVLDGHPSSRMKQMKKNNSKLDFLQHSKNRYDSKIGINLQSYKVNVYNIGINAGLENMKKSNKYAGLKHSKYLSRHRRVLLEPKNYCEIISKSMMRRKDKKNIDL
ncbi:unnamed protein product [Moneuplotes crassus]|uniref:non-specific serine/threonine protein kinase n=1 Tax=Euplotes crassus TaxID=5936 RepID=A0AAD1X2C7_EUPCR|nr:unnamed protein product [Moneuplotes crassus]